jgi:hypothetical protein
MVANEREEAANDDICAVLASLVAPGEPDACDPAQLDAFRLDHAHHEQRLPLLLRELAA